MQFRIALLAIFTVPLLFTGCGGGDSTSPYDGTWQATYPALSKDTTTTPDKIVSCSNPGAPIVIKDLVGTTRIDAPCTTELYDTTTTPPTLTSSVTVHYYADVSISIEAGKNAGDKDVLNAVVNGATFTGQCISTRACSAVSAAGDTLGLTR